MSISGKFSGSCKIFANSYNEGQPVVKFLLIGEKPGFPNSEIDYPVIHDKCCGQKFNTILSRPKHTSFLKGQSNIQVYMVIR